MLLQPDKEKRTKALNLRLNDGLSYAAIGEQLGLSRQRIQQLLRPPKAIYDLIWNRAGHQCQDCGIGLPAKSGSGCIHHIGSEEDYNDIDNLILLCRSCHRNRHLSSQLITCTRCGHTWHISGKDLPLYCAGCNSPYWNRKRQIHNTPRVIARIIKTEANCKISKTHT